MGQGASWIMGQGQGAWSKERGAGERGRETEIRNLNIEIRNPNCPQGTAFERDMQARFSLKGKTG